MHLAFVRTRSQSGLSALPVTVEIHLSNGLPAFQVVGLSDVASREIRSRVRSAIVSSHLKWPDYNIAVNLDQLLGVDRERLFEIAEHVVTRRQRSLDQFIIGVHHLQASFQETFAGRDHLDNAGITVG